jgi:hypothetical protein
MQNRFSTLASKLGWLERMECAVGGLVLYANYSLILERPSRAVTGVTIVCGRRWAIASGHCTFISVEEVKGTCEETEEEDNNPVLEDTLRLHWQE